MMLANCNKQNAFTIAEKIRISVEEMNNFNYPQITISMGISTFPNEGSDIKNVIKQADDALRIAKEQGKNKIYLY